MPVLEIAEFTLAPGVTEEALLATRPALESFLRGREGFVSLRLLRDGDRWIDLAERRDRASALAAAEAAPSEPGLGPFFAALDPATATMRHLEVVAVA